MTDWYYHDPAQGRVGPLSAEQVRTRYVDRRIQRDTLAWHAGVREWQPLDRFSDELQLDTAAPDASQPPPLPPATPPPVSSARPSAARRPYAAAPRGTRSEEHTSELQSLMRTSYAVICLKKTNTQTYNNNTHNIHA